MNRNDVFDLRRARSDLFEQPTPVTIRHTRGSRKPPKDVPFMERPTCTIKEACKAAGMGRTKFYKLINGGELKTISVGRRRLVQVPSLLKFLKIEVNDER
ncbi:MAG: helix-turn-helix domain-containing protein [Rhizomicrobium sp.]